MEVEAKLRDAFPDLRVLVGHIDGVKVETENEELEKFKREMIKKVEDEYDLDTLKDVPILRYYRDFFWRIGIDPTKTRPAAEALIRRILAGKSLPKINTLVDTYNLASIEAEIALAAFDASKIKGDLLMRYANQGEAFLGIGMKEPTILRGKEIVVQDLEKLVAVYPYRDADVSKITPDTKDVILLVCGVPGIDEETLKEAGRIAIDYITRFCGGEGSI
ncbi:MAG: B3/4 domain-containing protein [Candidatus Hydrothermarchaeales archaeon]